MSKVLIIGLSILGVLLFDLYTNIEYYKVFSVAAFILALDTKIMESVRKMYSKYIIETLKEIRNEDKEDEDAGQSK